VHGHIVAKLLKRIGAGHEIAFAIDFHDHARFFRRHECSGRSVLRGFARAFLAAAAWPLLRKNLDSLLYEFLVVSRITQLDAASTSAARQSLNPAFVSSLSSLTSLAGIS